MLVWGKVFVHFNIKVEITSSFRKALPSGTLEVPGGVHCSRFRHMLGLTSLTMDSCSHVVSVIVVSPPPVSSHHHSPASLYKYIP